MGLVFPKRSISGQYVGLREMQALFPKPLPQLRLWPPASFNLLRGGTYFSPFLSGDLRYVAE